MASSKAEEEKTLGVTGIRSASGVADAMDSRASADYRFLWGF